MAMSPDFDLKAVAKRINEENRKEDERAALRRSEAHVEARRIAELLRMKDPGIRTIWGFGSTFEDSRPYRLDSDIDLAIEGGDILKLFSITEDSRFKIDLIDITGRDDGFAKMLRENGTRL
jgi:predicted nucleotidyltransferase